MKLLDPTDENRFLDRYELIGEIASGGMATVYLARIAGLGGFQRFVAIKRLHPHLAEEPEFVEMFLDEARLAAGIHHPHVVPILEVGASANGYYLVMEYIEGDTFARIVTRALSANSSVPRPIVFRVFLDALAGLHAAHELLDGDGSLVSLVHRDCSPQNILVGVDGSTRLTDFGVARATSRLSNTRSDKLKGKLAYMSPEQAKGASLDRRSDLFAMGIILWEVLAGRRLFKAETEAATLSRVLVDAIPKLSSVIENVLPSLDDVCTRSLLRDPDRRFQTAAEMADAVERAALDSFRPQEGSSPVASPREVAAYLQSLMGQEIAERREAVRTWLSQTDFQSTTGSKPRYDVTLPLGLRRMAPVSSMPEGIADSASIPVDRAIAPNVTQMLAPKPMLTPVESHAEFRQETSSISTRMPLSLAPAAMTVEPLHEIGDPSPSSLPGLRRKRTVLVPAVAIAVVLGGLIFWINTKPTRTSSQEGVTTEVKKVESSPSTASTIPAEVLLAPLREAEKPATSSSATASQSTSSQTEAVVPAAASAASKASPSHATNASSKQNSKTSSAASKTTATASSAPTPSHANEPGADDLTNPYR